jgi:hypothetical protein
VVKVWAVKTAHASGWAALISSTPGAIDPNHAGLAVASATRAARTTASAAMAA